MTKDDGLTYADDGRVEIPNDAATVKDVLKNAIGYRELAGVFLRSGELVHTPRIGEDGYIEEPGVYLGPAQVQPFTPAQLKALAADVYRFVGVNRKNIKYETLAPRDGVNDAYELARMGHSPNLRQLRGVTHTPAMRASGTVLDRPGYDQETGWLYLPDAGLELPPVPDKPTPAELGQARDELLAMVDQVPWAGDDNLATFLGLAMTPALRALLPGPYPLGVFTAANPGSGKSRLAAIIRKIHGGVLRGQLPEGEELRKQITATLINTTAPVITWDNLTGVVRSPVLEALLTTDTWSDRYLGFSRDVTAANDRLWLATGNNAIIGGDLGRRVLVVEVDHKRPDPHLRTDWRIKDLDKYLRERRGRLLAAMLTIARAWYVAGQDCDRDRGDDYATWAGALRAMLAMAMVPGRFGGETSTIASKIDPETAEWAKFLREIYDELGSGPFTVKGLVQALDTGQVDPDLLPGNLSHKWEKVADVSNTYGTSTKNKSGFSKSLGWWLANRSGRYAEGWKIEQPDDDNHGNAYKVVAPEGIKSKVDEAKAEARARMRLAKAQAKAQAETWKEADAQREAQAKP